MESITIKDIARICGVGIGTVSRAINDHPDINEDTKKMILDTIKKNHYIPNNSARNLKRIDAKAIAVLIKGITNPFFSSMIKVMEEEIHNNKYSMVLHHVEQNEDEVDVALELIKEKRLRGIIFLGGYFSHSKDKLSQLNVPFVLSTIGATEAGRTIQYSSVAVDDFRESYKMVNYLCELGHRDIVLITAKEEDKSIGKLRLEGYKKALEDHNIPVREELILPMDSEIEEFSIKNGYTVMKKFLQQNIEFTAVFAISDSLAIGASRAILESGRKIPENVSVAGFDGIEAAEYYTPSITTIKQPVEDIARESINILFRVIKKTGEHEHKVFQGTLIQGESTRKIENR